LLPSASLLPKVQLSGYCVHRYQSANPAGLRSTDKDEAVKQFEKLITTLDGIGMRTEVRDGADGKLLVFVRVRSAQKLIGEVYRSR
jgi:hypothetical protein